MWNSQSAVENNPRRGAATVEFAIVAPLFLILIMGTVEMGNALEASTQLSTALREAGRLAGMNWRDLIPENESPNQKIIRDIRNFLTAAGYPGSRAVISITAADGPGTGGPINLGDPANQMRLFRIDASLPFSEISSIPNGFMKNRDIRASLVMRAGRITLMN